ncbi:MAG: hypothetical protein AAF346_06300 [Pseudomonadota bacterium]
MWEVLSWLLFIIFIAGLLVVGGLLLRGYMVSGSSTNVGDLFGGSFFAPKPVKRLDVVDQATVDGRRRLVLVRRDNVEHLIMTGGPVDVVIETGIEPEGKAQIERLRPEKKDPDGEPSAKPARKFGQAVGE